MVSELEKSESWASHPSAVPLSWSILNNLKQQIKQQSKNCADVGLFDESLFSRCLCLYSSVAVYMIKLINPHQLSLPLHADTPQLMRLLPEWVADNMADFLLFGFQFFPSMISNEMELGLVTWLLYMLCHTNYISNPYLAHKLVEVLFVIKVHENTGEIYRRIMAHPICQECLPGALMRFYTEAEQTSSSGFCDKFTLRYGHLKHYLLII